MKKTVFLLLAMLPLLAGAQDVKQLKKQAKAGDSKAALALGDYHSQRSEYKKAAKYYSQAATPQGDFELGALYINGHYGTGSEADQAKGMGLLRRAAAAGNRDGRYWLAICYDRGIGGEVKEDSAFALFSQLAAEGDSLGMLRTAIGYDVGRGVEKDTALALALYRKAGDHGVGQGYVFLGEFYANGEYVEQDYDSAFALFNRAYAMGGDIGDAAMALADCYMNGIGTRADTVAAVPYLQEAVGYGSARAMSRLGDCFNYGWGGLKRDGDSALAYYVAASSYDDPRGDYMVGAWLYDQGMYERAMDYIVSAAGNGSNDAMLLYCKALAVGSGVDADPEAAYQMVREMAEATANGDAYTLLGMMHYSGLGCEQDFHKASFYYDTAALLGSTQAMMGLGDLYAAGYGVPLDTVEAVRWYERAVAAGSVPAMMRLAGSHQKGRVAPLDKTRAAALYQQAADLGNLDALCLLGLCYESGEGVVRNSRRAFGLYNEAAERGSAYGMYLVGMCYVEEVYVKADLELAFSWFLRAAEAGHLQSCYNVGLMYLGGEGVKKNKKEARRWLTLAAENGHPDAAEYLQQI